MICLSRMRLCLHFMESRMKFGISAWGWLTPPLAPLPQPKVVSFRPANGSNFNPKRTIKYNWSGTGVKVARTDASTQIDTTGLQPGSYQVSANLGDGSRNGVASCIARLTSTRGG